MPRRRRGHMDDDVIINGQRYVLRPKKANSVSRKKRLLTLTVREQIELRKLTTRSTKLFLLRTKLERLERDDPDNGEAADELLRIIHDMEGAMHRELFHLSYAPRLPRNTRGYRGAPCDTLEAVLSKVCHGCPVSFKEFMRFTVENASGVVLALFGTDDLESKRFPISPELAFIVLMMRLGGHFPTLAGLSVVLSIDEAKLSVVFKCAIVHVASTFGDLLALEKMKKIPRAMRREWRDALQRKFATVNAPMDKIPNIENVAGAIDGCRLEISRPCESEVAGIVYSGYTGAHDVLFIVIVAPCGMVIALSPPEVGRHNDLYPLNTSDVKKHLKDAELSVIGDAIFHPSDEIVPLPNELRRVAGNFSAEECAALSRARIIVEWAIGETRSILKFLNANEKHHLLGSGYSINDLVTTAFILHNIRVCMDGTNASGYMDCLPPDVATYLGTVREGGKGWRRPRE